MFRIVVNGLLIGTRKEYGDARQLGINAKKTYTNDPIVTIEDKIGRVIEIIK